MINLHIKKMIFAFILIPALILTSGVMSSCGGKNVPGIIITGSTSVQPYAEILAEEYAHLSKKDPEKYPEFKIDVLGGGSSAGIQAAEAGTADIGMSSRALKPTELYKDPEAEVLELKLITYEIAKDGLAIIINPGNIIDDLSLEQVRKIYTGEITNWSELGGHDAKIHVSTREEGSGTRSAFEDLVMNKERITPKAIVQDSNGSIRLFVSDDIDSIGFISLGLVEPKKGQKEVKAIKLEGVEATEENIINGSYNLRRSFLFVTLPEPSEKVKKFIDFVLSPEGQQILKHEGLIPNN